MQYKNKYLVSGIIAIISISIGCKSGSFDELAFKKEILYSMWNEANLDTMDLQFLEKINDRNWNLSIYNKKFGQSELWEIYLGDTNRINKANLSFKKGILMDYLICYAHELISKQVSGLEPEKIRVSGIPVRGYDMYGENPIMVKIGLHYSEIDTILPFMIIKGRESDTIRYDLTQDRFIVSKIDGMETLKADVYIFNRIYNEWLNYSIETRTDWE